MAARLFYRDAEDERADKLQQERLLAALNAWERALRRDECGAWTIRGKHGTVFTRGDGRSWSVYAQPASTVDPEGSPRAWRSAKRQLTFMAVAQDGDSDGVFRLDRLPTVEEAEIIRDILGIRKRVELSAEELERRRAQAVSMSRARAADILDENRVTGPGARVEASGGSQGAQSPPRPFVGAELARDGEAIRCI